MELIRNLKQLKKAILEERKGISDKELFVSDIYQVYLTTMVKGFLPFTGKVKIYEGAEEIAYTEGKNVFINLNSPLVAGLSIKDKHKMFKGLNLHETGHMLFTDFSLAERILAKLKDGIIYPAVKDKEELEDFIIDTRHRSIVSTLFMQFQNVIEDGYIDRVVSKLAPGYAPYLRMVHQKDLEMSKSYDEMKEDGLSKIPIFFNSVLHYARFGLHTYKEDCKDDLIEEIKKAEKIVKSAVFNHSPLKRCQAAWEILLFLYKLLEEELKDKEPEKTSSEGSKGESSPEKSSKEDGEETSDPSESSKSSEAGKEKSEKMADALSELSSSVPTEDPIERKEPTAPSKEAVEIAKGISGEETEEKPDKDVSPKEASETETKELDNLMDDLAKENVEKEQESAISKKLGADLEKDAVGVHRNVRSKIIRTKEVTRDGIARYDREHQELDTIVRKFIKDFLKEITERQIGDTQKSLYFGKRLTVQQVYRKDKRIFSNKIAPEDVPNMAVGVLVDLSGSMMGTKEDVARKCAYITYQFCQKLDIPCFVVGHDVDFSTGVVRLACVADELSLDKKDAMRIMSLEARGDNRDGYALRYCYRKLEAIEAETKIMFVISDGLPQDSSSVKVGACRYEEELGTPDLRDAVQKAMKKDIETIVAGIGSDADRIKRVYKEGLSDKASAKFIDISDLSKLPKSFIKILKVRLS